MPDEDMRLTDFRPDDDAEDAEAAEDDPAGEPGGEDGATGDPGGEDPATGDPGAEDPATSDRQGADDGADDPTGAVDADVAPAVSAATWRPDGAACDACGSVVQRRWRDDGELVCVGCVEW